MSVVVLGHRDSKEPYDVTSYWGAVLPNRKVLSNDEERKEAVENTIKVRSEVYTEDTGEEHMPAEEMEDSDAKKIMKEAGIS